MIKKGLAGLMDLAKAGFSETKPGLGAVKTVKMQSREAFKNMPKPKKVQDKRFKKQKYKDKFDE